MSTDYQRVSDFLKIAIDGRSPEQLARFRPRHDPAPPRVPGGASTAAEAIEARWQLPLPATARDVLLDEQTRSHAATFDGNIEHLIGTVKVPVGLIGPL